MKISIFIADEGYGHAMRQKNIIHELLDHIPFVEITVYGKEKLDLISDEFKDALNYVDIFNLMLTVKDELGNLDIENTKINFIEWLSRKDIWYTYVMKHIDPSTDLIISDSVPQVSQVAKELKIKLLNIQHFTWDWLYLALYGEDHIYRELNNYYTNWGEFIFPPLTPKDNLKMHHNSMPIDFIVNRRLIRQTKINLNNFNDEKNILLMNNGTNSLTKVIEDILQKLPVNENWKISSRSDFISEKIKEIAFKRNDVKIINDLSNMHLAIAKADIIVARGGYNILSEILSLRKSAIILEEKHNPEIVSNLNLISNYENMHLASKDNVVKDLNKLIKNKSINSNFKHTPNLSALGACQVVLKIFNFCSTMK